MLVLPVMLPLLGAGACLVLGRRQRAQAAISVGTLTIVLMVAIALLAEANRSPLVLELGNWATPVGIALVADRMAVLLLVISVAVTLAVLSYSVAQGLHDGEDATPVAVFHPAFLLLSAGVSNAFLAGDIFNLFVGFEILLAASFVLITLGGSRDRMRSGAIYVVVSLIGSVVFLIAIALIYASLGTVNLAQLAGRMGQIDPTVALAIESMLLIAFGLKAAIFPLSAWLPDSYPTAPAPVTAVFAGLLTKVGVYAIIRVEVLLFPSGRLNSVLMVLAIATMVIGILGAVAQLDVKRLLSFTLISHIGYMLWGVATGTRAGLSAAIFYVIHHITVQTSLFLVAGLMERRGGTTSLVRLGSLARLTPLLAALYLVPALNLAGIPPMSGFLGKAGLVEASAARGTTLDWVAIGGGLAASLLTLYAVTKAWNMAFWQEAPAPLPEGVHIPRGMYGSTIGLVVLSLVFTFGAGPIYRYADAAAHDMRERTPYITAVLPEGSRGSGASASAGIEGSRIEADLRAKREAAAATLIVMRENRANERAALYSETRGAIAAQLLARREKQANERADQFNLPSLRAQRDALREEIATTEDRVGELKAKLAELNTHIAEVEKMNAERAQAERESASTKDSTGEGAPSDETEGDEAHD